MIDQLRAPEPLKPNHDTASFNNGRHPSLDDWLSQRALASEGLSARTYVVCPQDAPSRIAAYYCISTGTAQRSALPNARLRKGMPDDVPLMLIGRLAIDVNWQGKGLGSVIVSSAIRRCRSVSDIAGVRAIAAQAIDESAAGFYLHHGFIRSPIGDRLMLMPIEIALSYQ
jgi:GNAT superfamily N-acetyltransferase